MLQTEEIFENVRSYCDNYDLIFIDEDYSYDGVKRDFDLYKKLLSNRGYVVFHDIDPNNVYDDQVYKHWCDIEGGSKVEIVCSKSSGKIKSGEFSEHWGGIGLWRP